MLAQCALTIESHYGLRRERSHNNSRSAWNGRPLAPEPKRRRQRRAVEVGAKASQPMDTPPPYSLLAAPVYSLATAASGSGRASMNIHTYATPARRMVVALYQDTLTYENMMQNKRGVLQILHPRHAQLVQLLGKSKGRDVDKLAQLARLGQGLEERFGVQTLADCLGAVELTLVSSMDVGDHAVAVCDVGQHWTAPELAAGGAALTSAYLREQGLL